MKIISEIDEMQDVSHEINIDSEDEDEEDIHGSIDVSLL